MKGGGGVGIAGRGEGESHSVPSRPYPPGIHPGGKTLILVQAYPGSYLQVTPKLPRSFTSFIFGPILILYLSFPSSTLQF